jgi:hypothetical protein
MTEQQTKSFRGILIYVAPETLERKIGMMFDDAIEAERERCAKIIENAMDERFYIEEDARQFVAAIRDPAAVPPKSWRDPA